MASSLDIFVGSGLMVTLNQSFFLVGFLALQVLLVFLCFRPPVIELIHAKRFRRIAALLGAEASCVFLLLLGAYAEQRWVFWGTLRGSVSKLVREHGLSPPEVLEVKGDPSLSQWVQKQRPNLPRPHFTSAEAVHTWQTSLRSRLLEVFDLSDISVPVDVHFRKISSTVVAQNIMRTFLTFESFDGTSIPAYLFTPMLPGPHPAILVLHGHVKESEEGITQTAGIVDSYQHGAAFALAKGGYVVLTMEFRGFGYLGARVKAEHRLVAYNAILGGSFYKAIVSKDIKYALDFLQSLEEVDSRRLGITGVSFGGEMAVTYAALDGRIKVVVFQGFGGSLGAKRGVIGRSRKQQPHYDHIIPGYNTYLYREDIFSLIARRPLLGIRGDQDYSRNPRFLEVVGKAYKALSASSLFRFEIVPGGHEYFIQPAIQFFKQHL